MAEILLPPTGCFYAEASDAVLTGFCAGRGRSANFVLALFPKILALINASNSLRRYSQRRFQGEKKFCLSKIRMHANRIAPTRDGLSNAQVFARMAMSWW